MARLSSDAPKARTKILASRPIDVDAPGILRTQRLALRPLTSRDRAEFLRVLALNPEQTSPLGLIRAGDSLERAFERQLELTREADRTGRAWRRAAFLPAGQLVGCFNLGEITRGLCFAGELSWWLAPDQTGLGYATEGLRAVIDHAMADIPRGLGLHTLRAHIHPGNVRSLRLALRLGLTHSGGTAQVCGVEGWQTHQVWELRISSVA